MTETIERTSLIDRLEHAPSGDRAFDWDIHIRNGLSGVGAYGSHPHYTTSIDAAVTLIPAGSSLEHLGQFMCFGKDGQPVWQARIRGRTLANVWDKGKRTDKMFNTGLLPSAALAVCVAALKCAKASAAALGQRVAEETNG